MSNDYFGKYFFHYFQKTGFNANGPSGKTYVFQVIRCLKALRILLVPIPSLFYQRQHLNNVPKTWLYAP